MKNVFLFCSGGGRNFIFFLLFNLCCLGIFAQECIFEHLNQTDPPNFNGRSGCYTSTSNNYIIPVAIHIINHGGQGGTTFPTDSDIQSVIDNTNSILGPKFTLVPIKNPSNCNSISFRPPQIFTSINPLLNKAKEIEIKNLSRKDPNLVCNIWFVDRIIGPNGDADGYAYLPFESSNTPSVDGIVISKRAFGNTKSVGKILAHEFGHYLGLYHVWGKNEFEDENCHSTSLDCTHGDFIPDTERCRGPLSQAQTTHTCEVNDDIWLWYIAAMPNVKFPFCASQPIYPCRNIMNYHEPRNEFTAVQFEAMDQYLVSYRPNLGAFSNSCISCSDPCFACYYGTPFTDPNPSSSGDFCSPCHSGHEHITNYNITGNVTYNNAMFSNQTINVKSGGKLKITNFVYFNPGTGINVESGGTLELSGGHLTSCSNYYWIGVSFVRGGNVDIINGGTISAALYGVYNLSGNSGGNLICNGAHFYDNIYGVFLSKANVSAEFKNSSFTGMAHGVYLDNLPGKTTFSDCTFAYQSINGITSFGSIIDVSSNNRFTGCDNGVAAYNLFGSNTQSKIGDALLANSISNCNKGVYAVNAELLIKNNYLQGNSFSLYYSGQNIFQSTANTFSGNSYAEGIYSTGDRSNESHDNQYNSDVGIFPYLYNGGYTFYNNCFHTQWWDVNVPTGAQINIAQEGPGGSAASNCFTKGGVPDFICEASQTLIYKVPNSSSAPICLIPETPGNYILDPVNGFSNISNCGAGSTGVSEYSYLKKIGCDDTKLRQIIESLKSTIIGLKNKITPLTTAEKATLAKSERHLKYAINQWAWCLRNMGKRSQLKEWYAEWSLVFPDDIYYKIKRAEVSVELGHYSLAKSEIDTIKAIYPSTPDIWDALKITVDVHEAFSDARLQPVISDIENTIYQEIAKVYTISQTNHNILRRVAAMSAPEAAYGRALLAFLTGEQIEPLVNYTVIPRTTRLEKAEHVGEVVDIMPNPASENLNINIKNMVSEVNYTYELVNITGQKVMQGQLSDQNDLDVSTMSQGIYIMNINKDGSKVKTQKVVIQ
jgi:hypothetical protein